MQWCEKCDAALRAVLMDGEYRNVCPDCGAIKGTPELEKISIKSERNSGIEIIDENYEKKQWLKQNRQARRIVH